MVGHSCHVACDLLKTHYGAVIARMAQTMARWAMTATFRHLVTAVQNTSCGPMHLSNPGCRMTGGKRGRGPARCSGDRALGCGRNQGWRLGGRLRRAARYAQRRSAVAAALGAAAVHRAGAAQHRPIAGFAAAAAAPGRRFALAEVCEGDYGPGTRRLPGAPDFRHFACILDAWSIARKRVPCQPARRAQIFCIRDEWCNKSKYGSEPLPLHQLCIAHGLPQHVTNFVDQGSVYAMLRVHDKLTNAVGLILGMSAPQQVSLQYVLPGLSPCCLCVVLESGFNEEPWSAHEASSCWWSTSIAGSVWNTRRTIADCPRSG